MMKELFFQPSGISYRVSNFRVDRRTIVFIHGLTGSSSAWFEYEKILEAKFNILNIDLLVHGNSRKLKEHDAYSIEAHADSIAKLLRHVNVGKFILVTHSLGALIGLELLSTPMEKALGCIFLSPPYAVGTAALARIVRWPVTLAATALRLCPLLATVRGRTDYSKYRNTGDWNVYRMYADIRNTTLRTYLFTLSEMYRFKQTGKWEQLSIPVLIVHGGLDSLVPMEHAVRMSAVVQKSKLIIIDDGDHIIVLNNVIQLSREIEKFMGRLD